MKVGDVGFGSTPRGTTMYFRVASVTKKKIVLDVLNGGYDYTLEIVNVPAGVGDYNDAIVWYNEQKAKKKPKIKKQVPRTADEIPF